MTKTVAFVLAPAHSGSTLLGHFLHANPKILHIGEIIAVFAQNRPYRCYYCGDEPCNLWGTILSEEFVKRVYRRYRNDINFPKRLVAPIINSLTSKLEIFEPPGSLFNHIFKALPEIDIIVDSSKKTAWAKWNSRNPRYRTVYICLTRDLRALVASKIRKYSVSLKEASENTVSTVQHLRQFVREQDPSNVITLKYEDLASQSEEVGKSLCDFLNICYTKEMLEYYRFEQHIIGGNPATTLQSRLFHDKPVNDLFEHIRSTDIKGYDYYKEGHKTLGFKIDDRWNDTFDAKMLKEFESIGGQLNRELGYLSSGDS